MTSRKKYCRRWCKDLSFIHNLYEKEKAGGYIGDKRKRGISPTPRFGESHSC